ncbi:unnamed protein product [Lactuca virosa]|uniref:Uncharacterized protein n=1 Tax=Lactuca virosa TaxID=75947 RepID=A0AAU9MS79_9ASTR|nr:unnamed protein product [Lactuca virosa]
MVTTINTRAKPIREIIVWAIACILKRRRTMILTSKRVKDEEKDTHIPNKKKKCKPRACSPEGEGHGSHNITKLDRLHVVSMNTKKGWIPLSIPMRLREVKTQSTKKKPDSKQN